LLRSKIGSSLTLFDDELLITGLTATASSAFYTANHIETGITMSQSFYNPRRDPIPTTVQSSYSMPHLLHACNSRQRLFRTSAPGVPTKPTPSNPTLHNSNPCFDWIFSSASNTHIAIDRSAFKTYTPFKSYVLTIADHRQILVKGIGSVDLDLRRKWGSRKCHTITLDNVLHAPGWMCNIFSDVYFEANGQFEHSWATEGVQFMKEKDQGKLRTWGFTEEFCGLDRLVLARNVRGRSPMLEDPDREVFSINVKWPQGQMDRWEA
jgi:hypothetical protein